MSFAMSQKWPNSDIAFTGSLPEGRAIARRGGWFRWAESLLARMSCRLGELHSPIELRFATKKANRMRRVAAVAHDAVPRQRLGRHLLRLGIGAAELV